MQVPSPETLGGAGTACGPGRSPCGLTVLLLLWGVFSGSVMRRSHVCMLRMCLQRHQSNPFICFHHTPRHENLEMLKRSQETQPSPTRHHTASLPRFHMLSSAADLHTLRHREGRALPFELPNQQNTVASPDRNLLSTLTDASEALLLIPGLTLESPGEPHSTMTPNPEQLANSGVKHRRCHFSNPRPPLSSLLPLSQSFLSAPVG